MDTNTLEEHTASKIRDESNDGSGNSSKTLVTSYKATQSHNPDEKIQYLKTDNNSAEI
jgi:hypothetical protein